MDGSVPIPFSITFCDCKAYGNGIGSGRHPVADRKRTAASGQYAAGQCKGGGKQTACSGDRTGAARSERMARGEQSGDTTRAARSEWTAHGKRSGDRTGAARSERTVRGGEEVWKREWFFY